MKILVVEDQVTIRHLVVELLESEGHHVTACETAEQALSVLRLSVPLDCVVLDWILPDRVASDLVPLITAHPSRPLCIVISGYPVDVNHLSPADRERMHILGKPFSPRILLELVETAKNDSAG